jgi:hydrogenase-4 component H
MIESKLRELMIALKGGIVTMDYPLGPAPPVPERFRGKLELEITRCIGCGGCAAVCPARLIVPRDPSPMWRKIDIYRERCTYCGRCEDVCQEGAIRLTHEFELATNDKADLTDHLEIFMATCGRCGRCFKPDEPLDRIRTTGLIPV